MKKIGLILLSLVFWTCDSADFDPDKLVGTSYISNPGLDQEFSFYYDDGKKVVDALNNPIITLSTVSGSFSSEQLLKLQAFPEVLGISDSLTSYTYWLGTNYAPQLKAPATVRIHYDYPYTNSASSVRSEYDFLTSNINQLKVVKLERNETTSLFANYPYSATYVDFQLDPSTQTVSFETDDIFSLYGLVYTETPKLDTVTVELSGGRFSSHAMSMIGYAKPTLEGTDAGYIINNVLTYAIRPAYRNTTTYDNASQVRLYRLDLTINEPELGVMDLENSSMILHVEIPPYDSDYPDVTTLYTTPNTIIEIIALGQVKEYIIVQVSGEVFMQAINRFVDIDMEVKFIRMR